MIRHLQLQVSLKVSEFFENFEKLEFCLDNDA